MNKLWLIIQREYLTRVKKKSFLYTTLLTPLALGAFFLIVGFIFSYKGDEQLKIAIQDTGSILKETNIKSSNSLDFTKSFLSKDELTKEIENGNFDAVLILPEIKNMNSPDYSATYYSDKQLSLELNSQVKSQLRRVVRDYKIAALGFNKDSLKILDTKIQIESESISEESENKGILSSALGAGLGSIMGMIMMFIVTIYGSMVMRSVMEEKTNRIVEVMISSVKPMQLMLGKIIGVGGVGLTQLIIWAILIPLIYMGAFLVMGIDTSAMSDPNVMAASSQMNQGDIQDMILQISMEISEVNWFYIIGMFIFYFIGGYFLFSSLYAAIGSAIGDDMGEAQSLTIPITLPIIISFYISMVVVRAPDSTLAVWASIFPLFSPIVMPARLGFNPPLWQLALSMVLLIATTLFIVWISAKIYRVGILMYGKKASFKELWKWMF